MCEHLYLKKNTATNLYECSSCEEEFQLTPE